MELVNELATAYRTACETELQALKPGNIHQYSDRDNPLLEDFERSASASASEISAPGRSVGERILSAVQATRKVVTHNTNLGIILLCAPIAHACIQFNRTQLNSHHLKEVLSVLTVQDAQLTYQAIRLAEPGGMGDVEQESIDQEPSVTLLQAMQMAAERDRIAYLYVHAYNDLFEFTVPQLKQFLDRGFNLPQALTGVFLNYLAKVPDSLIARKFGLLQAQAISDMIAPLADHYSASVAPGEVFEPLMSADGHLKNFGINPGTTADIMVATLFLALLERVV